MHQRSAFVARGRQFLEALVLFRVGFRTREIVRSERHQRALVAMAEKGGPADQAGIQSGDVILAFNEKPVQTSADLARLMAGTKPRTTATADIWRKGSRQSAKVTVAELSPEPPARAPGRPRPPGQGLFEKLLRGSKGRLGRSAVRCRAPQYSQI
jgi:predicted metalloprotease with PDZ domain